MAQDPAAQEGQARQQGALLSELSNEMVRIQKKFWGRGAVEAKSYLFDDFLLIVMRGGLTIAEESMLAKGHEDEVRAFRQVWQNDMTGILTSMVQERTGRTVVNYQSQVMFDPDVVVEMFMFGREDGTREPATLAEPTPEHIGAIVGTASRAVIEEPPPAAAPAGTDPARGRTEEEREQGR
jgi:uncharacterized protein YbcI